MSIADVARVFSRTLLSVQEAQRKLWPVYNNVSGERTGRRYYRYQSKAISYNKWPEQTLAEITKPIGYRFPTVKEQYREKKKEYWKTRGKKYVHKGQGKKSSRRK